MSRELLQTAPHNMIERLHKRIAASGLCSRRAAEELIIQGRVEVNGGVVTEMGVKVGPEDEVRVDGRPIAFARTITLIMNKPLGYVTTLFDPQGRPTVKQLLPQIEAQVKPVGRLDMDSEGLLLFTNDGKLAQRLTHPRFGIEKEYQVVVEGTPPESELDKLRKGIYIVEGGKTAPARVVTLRSGFSEPLPLRAGRQAARPKAERSSSKSGGRSSFREPAPNRVSTSILRITIHEGRKRQVRLMFEAIGHSVQSLRRVRIGPIVLKNLPPGACRILGKKEVDKLKQIVGLD